MQPYTLHVMKKSLFSLLLVIITVLGPCATTAKAFSLEEPKTTYEDFLAYDGIKMFINGRYVEFTEETGYPYIENGTMMISFSAIAKGFNADIDHDGVRWIIEYDDGSIISFPSTLIISKYDNGVQVEVGEAKQYLMRYVTYVPQEKDGTPLHPPEIVKKTVEGPPSITVDGPTMQYVPLRLVFEGFGLTVRWDKDTRTVHVETPQFTEAFPFIDFKSANVISIQDLDVTACQNFVYDGVLVDKDYINILKNSDQYCVYIKDGTANIFSYQYLGDLNYLYKKAKQLKGTVVGGIPVLLHKQSADEVDFFESIMKFVPTHLEFLPLMHSNPHRVGVDEQARTNHYYRLYTDAETFSTTMEAVHKIADQVKRKTNIPSQQAVLVSQLLHKEIKYEIDNVSFGQGAYTALVEKEAACGGFAAAFQLIMEELKIPSIYMTGQLISAGGEDLGHHAWNQVYVDDA